MLQDKSATFDKCIDTSGKPESDTANVIAGLSDQTE